MFGKLLNLQNFTLFTNLISQHGLESSDFLKHSKETNQKSFFQFFGPIVLSKGESKGKSAFES